MKQIIILSAILPLLLLFVSQFAVQVQNQASIHYVTGAVDAAKEQAKRDGCFTYENIDALKLDIATVMKLEKDDITVIATDTPKYRVNEYSGIEQIHYRVETPIKKLMAGNRFLGISDAKNAGRIIVEGSIASELLMP